MDFLKEILGDELFAQVSEKINAYNGNEANKDKPVKIGNLGGGDYVGKAKYDALQALLDGKTTELDTANNLIADLKKSAKDDETLQGKVTAYETQVQQLQAQLNQTQLDAELKVALLSAGAKADDIDYLTFKLNSKGEALELDDQGHIKGIDDKLAGLKTQFPAQFETGTSGRQVIGDNRLPQSDTRPVTVTKESFAKMGYNERLKLKQENEQLFRQLAAR